MEGPELIKYAKEKASEGVDLFALLGIDATTSAEDIHKAWRRTALKHHPDKAGANYDAALYESFGRARDVLIDPEARAAYNKIVSAALQQKAKLEQMSSRRRQLVEDLERREAEARGVKKARTEHQANHDPERAATAARGMAKMEERKRLIREAEERERLWKLEAERQEQPEAAREPPPPPGEPARECNPPASPPTTNESTQPTQPAARPDRDRREADDYDDQIADLERRIRERKEEKLRRKVEKKARKNGGATPLPGELGMAGEVPAAAEPHKKPPAPTSSDDGPKADAPLNRPAPEGPPKPAGGEGEGDGDGAGSSNGGGGNRFASTMARLRAAQAQRDEEKRKRAVAEAGTI